MKEREKYVVILLLTMNTIFTALNYIKLASYEYDIDQAGTYAHDSYAALHHLEYVGEDIKRDTSMIDTTLTDMHYGK